MAEPRPLKITGGWIHWTGDPPVDSPWDPSEQGPAGHMKWLHDGSAHRVNGPAVGLHNGFRSWYRHGVLHRLGGPAVDRGHGCVEYWVDGYRCITEEEYLRRSSLWASIYETTTS